MAKFVLFPELAAEMAKSGEKQQDIAKLLQMDNSQVTRRLNGSTKWSEQDTIIICKHYNREYKELFKKNVKEEEENEISKN